MKTVLRIVYFFTLFFTLYSFSPLTAQAQTSNFKSLREGNTGSEVVVLQQKLQEKGFFPTVAEITGYFGKVTKSAVMAFQKAKNLSVVGVFGPRTNEALAQIAVQETTFKTALPLYIYPSATEPNWNALITAGGSKVDFVVANVNSGPGTSAQTTWTNMISKAVAAGIKVYGYVDTNYATKSGTTVDSEVALWFKLYPQVTGIFLDRVSSGVSQIPYYKSRYDYVKNRSVNFKVVINPGTNTVEGYMAVSDVNLMFAGSYSSWLTKVMPTWVANYPKERFYTIVYGVSNETDMKDVVRTAKARNFGRIFITSASGLSSALPSYFQAELAEITVSPVNGVCGSVNNTTVSSVPTTNLCVSGTASTVAGSGPWTWNCIGQNGGTTTSCSAQKIILPSKTALPLYIYPSATEPNWNALITAGGSKVDFVVANVSSGPGTSAQTTWTNIISKAVAAGIKVYGYVDTNYGSTSGSVVDSQVSNWYKLYPQVTGIFLDRVSSGASQIPYYKSRYDYVKRVDPKLYVVISPGVITDEGYMNVSDVNLMFAGSHSSWLTKVMPTWVANYPKERFYAIVYGVSTETNMKDVVRTAKARNFGRIFVTSASGLSSALPSYFQAELTEITGIAVAPTPVNGVCGSANGTTVSTAPTTNLCSTGTTSLVSGSGPWTWSCAGLNGGTTANCSAQKTIISHTLSVSKTGSGSITSVPAGISCGTACSASFVNGTSITLTAVPSTGYIFSGWNGACTGTGSCYLLMNSAKTVGATFTFVVPPVNGTCGSSNNTTVPTVPTTNFCSSGTASPVSVSGTWTWTWTCAGSNGGTTASCSAQKTTKFILGQRVIANANLNVRSTPSVLSTVLGTQALGSIGAVVSGPVSAEGYYWWQINYDTGADGYSVENYLNVYVAPSPINGVCGSANNTTVSTAPTTNLCSAGTASAVSGSGPWSWNCVGLHGGTSAGCSAQKVPVVPVSSRTFTEDTALNIRNPERGLYYPINLFSNTLADCQYAISKGYTIVYTKAILPKTADLTQALSNGDEVFSGNYISKIRDGLAAVRSCGAKAIVRFYYLKDDSSSQDPDIGIIKGHLTQIKSVLAENSDVVMVFQAGLIGAWGEWHGSNLAGSATARADILSSLLNALPTNRMVQVRTPSKRHQVFSGTSVVSAANAIGGTALGAPVPFSGTNTARTGHHDDCFMGTLRNYGTYSTFGSSAYNQEVAYVAQNTRFTPMGGESCRFAKRNATTLVYTYDPTETYKYTNLAHIRARSKKEMATMHWSYLNGTYSEEVRDSMGGNAGKALVNSTDDPLSTDADSAHQRTVADHNCPSGVFDSSTCIYEGFYPELLRRLGYRLVLLNSSFSSQIISEGTMQIDFALRNIGFAAMFNARPVYLVLHNGSNRYNIALTGVDPRTWEPKSDVNGTSIVDSTSIINVSKQVNLPTNMAPGTYSVSLWLPDQTTSLQLRPQYSVRFANTGMWNATLGLNLLAANAVVVSP